MIKDPEGIISAITDEIQARMTTAVVGLSGGVDSSLVATLCTKALGTSNVYGVHMPYDALDRATFNSRSEELAKHLGLISVRAPIHTVVEGLDVAMDAFGGLGTKLQQGNARSRARMLVLYAIAGRLNEQEMHARVVGTGNLSEDYIGYDTKGGDALCDFFPIGELFKSEVYQLIEYLGVPEALIDRVPSAGLWVGQTDEGELGHTYDSMEPVIKQLIAGVDIATPTKKDQELVDFVIQRHLRNKHKHEAPPTLALRAFCD
jgi:NAD+ synthase